MKQRPTRFGKKPIAAKKPGARASTRVLTGASAGQRAIPLTLAPLLLPYKTRGKLFLRIERLPQLASLSRGRLNRNGSWSLASDELEDLEILLPEGTKETETVTIRIIDFADGKEDTLSALDVDVFRDVVGSGTEEVEAEERPVDTKFARVTAGLVQRKDDPSVAAHATAPLEMYNDKPGDSESAAPTAEILAQKGEAFPSIIAHAPTSTRPDGSQDLEEIRRLQDELAALQEILKDRDGALAQAASDFERARENWTQEAEAALRKTEQACMADEAARVAAVEAQWQDKSTKLLEETRAAAEAVRDRSNEELRGLRDELATLQVILKEREATRTQAVEEVRVTADAARDRSDAEIRRLQDELVTLQETLKERDGALAQAASDFERARERWTREAEAALRKTEQACMAGEAARVAAVEAQWQDKSARLLEETRAAAELVRDRSNEELGRLQDELATLQETLKDRDTASAQAAIDFERARECWAREAEDALRKAEQAWKDDETARVAAIEAQWQDKSTRLLDETRAAAEAVRDRSNEELRRLQDELVTLQVRLKERDGTRTQAAEDVRTTDDAARDRSDEEIRRLQDELATLQETLKDRDGALAQAAGDFERARESWTQEAEDALRKTEQAWKDDECARLSSAEAQWRMQSRKALAEATARYEAVEQQLVELRTQSAHERSAAANARDGSGSDEHATLATKPAAREGNLAPLYPRNEGDRSRGRYASGLSMRRRRMPDEIGMPGQDRRKSRGFFPDALVAVSLAIFTITTYPSIQPLLPERWQSNIGAIASQIDPILGRYRSPVGSPPPVSTNPVVQQTAVVVRNVNLRAGPSTSAKVTSTLARGRQVATVEKRGNWTLIQIDDENDRARPVQGWAYSSYLKEGQASTEPLTAEHD